MPELVSLFPFVAIALLFWLLIIRPNSKRQKEVARMQAALTAGDEVMLTSGIFGRVTSTEGEQLRVEVADGVTITVARGAIGTVVSPAVDTTAHTTAETDAGAEES